MNILGGEVDVLHDLASTLSRCSRDWETMDHARAPPRCASMKVLTSGILVDMVLKRDRRVYRETTADSSIKPREVVDSLILIEQGLLI